MADGITLTTSSTLEPDKADAVSQLLLSATDQDGFTALNEAARLHLQHPRQGVSHVLAVEHNAVAGYAQLDSSGAASTGQLVVDPAHRRQGIGTALLAKLIEITPQPLQIWAMGNSVPAQVLAASQGLIPARELLVMTRSLAEPVPQPTFPAGTSIRTFVVGQDEAEWLTVNGRAFSHHPEQGQITAADLAERFAEPWFDPAGFFLAFRGEAMVGFHWTKQHQDQLGEVYVLGVEPTAGGAGLGKALLLHGLSHLRGRGNTSVELYVEADHDRAVNLYSGVGFTVTNRDVMYASRL